jgi:hypothetical protein
VLAHDRAVRVYSTLRAALGQSIYACSIRPGGRMTLLAAQAGHPGSNRSLGGFVLAGSIVGYLETQFGVDSGTHKLVVVDVAARRSLRSIDAGHYVDAGLILSEGVTRFVLTAHGSVAWISSRSEHSTAATFALHVAPRTGAAITLAHGPSIDSASLSLAGGTLSWKDAGVRHTARMP